MTAVVTGGWRMSAEKSERYMNCTAHLAALADTRHIWYA